MTSFPARARQQIVGQQRQHHFFGNGLAFFRGHGDAVGIDIEQESGVGSGRLDQRGELQRDGRGGSVGLMRECAHALVNQDEAKAVAVVEAAQDFRRRAVGAIDHDLVAGQRGEIEGGGQIVEIEIESVVLDAQLADTFPVDEGETAQVIEVEQLACFGGGEIGSGRAQKLQRVPFGGVMTRADGNSSGGGMAADRMLQDWSRDQVKVDHLAAAGEQSGEHAFPQHHTGGARIPSDDDGAGSEKSSESGGEIEDVLRGEPRPDDAAQAHLGDPHIFRHPH